MKHFTEVFCVKWFFKGWTSAMAWSRNRDSHSRVSNQQPQESVARAHRFHLWSYWNSTWAWYWICQEPWFKGRLWHKHLQFSNKQFR